DENVYRAIVIPGANKICGIADEANIKVARGVECDTRRKRIVIGSGVSCRVHTDQSRHASSKVAHKNVLRVVVVRRAREVACQAYEHDVTAIGAYDRAVRPAGGRGAI